LENGKRHWEKDQSLANLKFAITEEVLAGGHHGRVPFADCLAQYSARCGTW
jgi:hypothetical protein